MNGKFTIEKTEIKDLLIIEPKVFCDDRGYFMETYNFKEFSEMGLNMSFVQDNQSKSKKGVLRGLHFQVNNPQGKLVRAISGEVYDVAVDLRKSSDTFGRWHGVVLSAKNKKQFYIPEGFAHGFLVLTNEAEFVYKCTRFYDSSDESGILYDDKILKIDWWKFGIDNIIVSDKDKKLSSFDDLYK